MDAKKHIFADSSSQTWHVAINAGTLKRAKAFCGFDVDSLVKRQTDKTKKSQKELQEEGGKAVESLNDFINDIGQFSEVLYAICYTQAEERGLTHEQFDEILSGDVLENAQMAFLNSLHDFFQQAPRKLIVRGLMEILTKTAKVNAQAMKRAEAMIATMTETNLEEMVDQQIDQALSSNATASPEGAAE